VPGHDGGDRPGEGPAIVRIIRQAVAHAERAEVREAQAQGAEDVGVFRDFLGRIARVVHENFLRRDVDAHGGMKLNVNFPSSANFMRLSEARLQAVLFRKTYSLHGFVE
jgi:hypothetical protein